MEITQSILGHRNDIPINMYNFLEKVLAMGKFLHSLQ